MTWGAGVLPYGTFCNASRQRLAVRSWVSCQKQYGVSAASLRRLCPQPVAVPLKTGSHDTAAVPSSVVTHPLGMFVHIR